MFLQNKNRSYLLGVEINKINFCFLVLVCQEINARAKWIPSVIYPRYLGHAFDLLLFSPVWLHPPYIPIAREINVVTVGRFPRHPRPMLGNLRRVAAFDGHLPNAGVETNLSVYKIDPSAIVRPGRQGVTPHINIYFLWHTAVRIDEVDVGIATHP